MRPRRSVLYMPGSNARALEKAKTLAADALILDLEDAVAPDAKEVARRQVCEAVRAGGFGSREVAIRVNGFATPYGGEDFQAALAASPDAILLPKIETPADLEYARKLAPARCKIALWAMIETPLAILNLKEIGRAAPAAELPLTCFVLGTNDLIKMTRIKAQADRLPLLAWLSMTVAAGRAFGITVVDGVYNALSAEEIAAARKIVEAFERPENQGKGAISLDGRMVERLHADIARETLSMAEAIAAKQ